MELLNQPEDGQLGDVLIENLESGHFKCLNVVVAFAKNSGVLRLSNAISTFRSQGGTVNVYVGVDLGGTSYEALSNLRNQVDALWVVHAESGQTFHEKTYNFVGEEHSMLVVGSNNLTGGGLWTNFESCLIIKLDLEDATAANVQSHLDSHISYLQKLGSSVMHIETKEDVEKLYALGYVQKEVAQRISSAENSYRPGGSEKLFGNGASAKLPRIKSQNNLEDRSGNHREITRTIAGADSTIWFESGKMTGGSRNILDLSMKSLVEHGDPSGTVFAHPEKGFMRGGVEFFGLNPEITDARKDITINFDGTDYFGNTILYPDGARANGTWRLQIKGLDASDTKITSTFQLKGGTSYLVDKILTFTKVADDYFYLSVFSSSELPSFETKSTILGRNGSSSRSRRLGLL